MGKPPHFWKTRHYRGGLRGIVNRDIATLLLPSVEIDHGFTVLSG
jgi:hypothetical protein